MLELLLLITTDLAWVNQAYYVNIFCFIVYVNVFIHMHVYNLKHTF